MKWKEIRERGQELKGMCDKAVAKGGSSNMNLNVFIQDLSCVQVLSTKSSCTLVTIRKLADK